MPIICIGNSTKTLITIILNPSGSNFAIANDKFEITVWSLEKQHTALGKIKGHTAVIKAWDYSRITRYPWSGGLDKKVKIWDMKDLSLFKNLPCRYPVRRYRIL